MRVLEGTFRKDRHGDQPQVSGGFPKAPRCLNRAERKLWKTFPRVPWIIESDQLAVQAAVSIYERILRNQQAQAATEEAGKPLSIKISYDGDGNERIEPKENPLITQELKLWTRLVSVLGILGLTPTDRAKVGMQKRDEKVDDKWADIL